jgi:hypothetical protein
MENRRWLKSLKVLPRVVMAVLDELLGQVVLFLPTDRVQPLLLELPGPLIVQAMVLDRSAAARSIILQISTSLSVLLQQYPCVTLNSFSFRMETIYRQASNVPSLCREVINHLCLIILQLLHYLPDLIVQCAAGILQIAHSLDTNS